MSRKVYNVSVIFDLHGVSCPGVWLCPKGKIWLKISLFGVSEVTKQVYPTFPLRFNERFHFQKTFRSASTLPDLHTRLNNSLVRMQLIQYPPATTEMVILAAFCAPLTTVLYPSPILEPSETSADVDLLFCPCKIFPGIIAPKAEISTKIYVKESSEPARGTKMNPTTVSSQKCKTRMEQGDKIIRQKSVCHTEYNLHCKCFLPKEYCKKKSAMHADRIRPPKLLRRSKSVTTSTMPIINNSKIHKAQKKWKDENGAVNGLTKYKSSEDPKFVKSFEEAEHELLPQSKKLCPSYSNEYKVQFRNFKTPGSIPNLRSIDNENRNFSDSNEEKEILQKCEVCSCPICIKYENYFIHRAIKHNRGDLKSKAPQKISSDNESGEDVEKMSPPKCFCFKDKKDFNEFQIKSNDVDIERKYSTRCFVCDCPIKQDMDNDDTAYSPTKISLDIFPSHCKCPRTANNFLEKDKLEETQYYSLGLREDFHNDLNKYYCKIIDKSEKSGQTPYLGFKDKRMKKPSSQSISNLQKNPWSYKQIHQKSSGIWDVKASDWNRK